MMPNTDVVIPIRLTRDFPAADDCFRRCVESLSRYTKNIRPIFVDDNSDEEGRRVIDYAVESYRHYPSAILVRTYKQRWYTRSANFGLRLVNTPWAVILNSDAFVQEGWLEELFTAVNSPEVRTACGRPVGVVGSVYSPNDPRRFLPVVPPQYVTAHCILVNMEMLKQIVDMRGTPGEYLDTTTPRTIHIFSDNELSYSAFKLGWAAVVSHHSHVDHEAGKSWGHLLGTVPTNLEVVNDTY